MRLRLCHVRISGFVGTSPPERRLIRLGSFPTSPVEYEINEPIFLSIKPSRLRVTARNLPYVRCGGQAGARAAISLSVGGRLSMGQAHKTGRRRQVPGPSRRRRERGIASPVRHALRPGKRGDGRAVPKLFRRGTKNPAQNAGH